MPLDILFDYFSVRLNDPEAVGHDLTINLNVTDLPDPYSLKVSNGVLHSWHRHTKNADLELTLTHTQLMTALLQPDTLEAAVKAGQVTAQGDLSAIQTLAGLMDTFDTHFSLISSNT